MLGYSSLLKHNNLKKAVHVKCSLRLVLRVSWNADCVFGRPYSHSALKFDPVCFDGNTFFKISLKDITLTHKVV